MIRDMKTTDIIKISSFFSSIFPVMRNSQSEIFQLPSKELDTNDQNDISTNK